MTAGLVNRNIANRALTFGIIGSIAGWKTRHDEATWGAKGKSAYLAHEATRFDKNMAGQHSLGGLMLTGLLLALTTWLLFESISYLIDLCLRRRAVQ